MPVVASGQVAASDTAIYSNTATAPVPVSAIFQNKSASLTETLVVSITPSGATERRLARSTLAPNEQLLINSLLMGNSDSLSATTTDATTVDYMVLSTLGGAFDIRGLDANGALKQVNTGIAGNQTVSGVQTAAGFVNTGVETTSIGASTAAAGSTFADAGALPAGTAKTYPTTAADGTKGVILNVADQVTGRTVFIGNGVANTILKVYGPSGAVINGASANAAFSSVSGKGVIAVCLSGSGNTWLMW